MFAVIELTRGGEARLKSHPPGAFTALRQIFASAEGSTVLSYLRPRPATCADPHVKLLG